MFKLLRWRLVSLSTGSVLAWCDSRETVERVAIAMFGGCLLVSNIVLDEAAQEVARVERVGQ